VIVLYPPLPLSVSSPLRDRRKRISWCDIAMQSSLRMNLHYSANGVEKVRTRVGLVETGTTRTTNELVGVGPRHRGQLAPHVRGRIPDRARLATPRCALVSSVERASFFRYRLLHRSRIPDAERHRLRYRLRKVCTRARAWEHAFLLRTFDRLNAFL